MLNFWRLTFYGLFISTSTLADTSSCAPYPVNGSSFVAYLPSKNSAIWNSTDFKECFWKCCESVECLSIFFVEEVDECYLAKCRSEACGFMATSRNVSFHNVRNESSILLKYGSPCRNDSQCSAGLICQRIKEEKICVCPAGWLVSLDGACFQLAPDTGSAAAAKPKGCTYGMDDCPNNEECLVDQEKIHSKRGKCRCQGEFRRNSAGICVKDVKEVNFTTAAMDSSIAPPLALVVPDFVETEENKKVIIDGTGSKGSNGRPIVEWRWSQIEGPLSENVEFPRTPILTFDKMKTGNYTFKLFVKDELGGESFATAHVFVREAVDYPPKAEAGSCDSELSGDIQVRLPVDAIFICGNLSSDDNGIVSWKWSLKESQHTADIKGSASPLLTVSNVQAGDYTFTLDVEDAKGQKASADVRVVVLKAENKPPVVDVGPNVTIMYPESSVILDGGRSFDDGRIVSSRWSQLSGPTQAKISNADNVRMTAADLVRGLYVFRLNVTDDGGLSSYADATVRVDDMAKAANVSASLPANLVVLNGSSSWDDAGVVRWLWTVMDESPAGLVLLGNSCNQPLLFVSNLQTPGWYWFNLTVFDKQGAANWTKVALHLIAGEFEGELVQFYLNVKLKDFSVKNQRKFVKQLSALLATNKRWDSVDVILTNIDEDFSTGRTRLTLYCQDSSKNSKLLSADEVIEYLDVRFSDAQESMSEEFNLDKFDAKHCRNKCSGHGKCDEFSKSCVCERFWMENFVKSSFSTRKSNCDWSVFYFVLLILIAGISSVGFVFGSLCLIRRHRRTGRSLIVRPTKKYRNLGEETNTNKKILNVRKFRGRNGYKHFTSSDDSASLLSSDDEETVFDKHQVVVAENQVLA